MDDFRANQFMMDDTGQIFLVDGPKALMDSVLGVHVVNTYHKTKHQIENGPHACARDADCPATVHQHSCPVASLGVRKLDDDEARCEPGSVGAPEARGTCVEKVCERLSEKTHVWDVANRPWLLPFIAERATGSVQKFLRSLITFASEADPDKRPDFGELLKRVDAFAKARSRRRLSNS